MSTLIFALAFIGALTVLAFVISTLWAVADSWIHPSVTLRCTVCSFSAHHFRQTRFRLHRRTEEHRRGLARREAGGQP